MPKMKGIKSMKSKKSVTLWTNTFKSKEVEKNEYATI